MLVVRGAVTFTAEEAVLECVLVRDVGMFAGPEFGELVGVVGVGAEESSEERLQFGLEWVDDNSAVVEAFMCSSWWHR